MDRTCINCGADGRANVIVGAIDNDEWRHVDPSVCVVHLLSQLTAERAAHAETRKELEAARNRLATVVDEAYGMQPVLALDEMISVVEREAFARHKAAQETAALLYRIESALGLASDSGADLVSVARACARVVEAARVLFDRNEVASYEGRIEGVTHAPIDDFDAVLAALDALAALRAGKETTDAR